MPTLQKSGRRRTAEYGHTCTHTWNVPPWCNRGAQKRRSRHRVAVNPATLPHSFAHRVARGMCLCRSAQIKTGRDRMTMARGVDIIPQNGRVFTQEHLWAGAALAHDVTALIPPLTAVTWAACSMPLPVGLGVPVPLLFGQWHVCRSRDI